MRKFLFTILVMIAFLLVSAAAEAQGIPVYDAASYTQLITEFNQMTQAYQKQLSQLDQAVQQTTALTGSRGMGSLENGPLEETLRHYLPDNWQDTMNMINASGLNNQGMQTQSLYNSLYSNYSPIAGADFVASDPAGPVSQAIDRRTQTTYAAMSASEQSYNASTTRTSTYEALLSQLDNTTDIKASIDLAARIAAENGLSMNDVMRLNSIQIQQKAAQDNETLTSYKRAHDANQYSASDAAKAFQPQE